MKPSQWALLLIIISIAVIFGISGIMAIVQKAFKSAPEQKPIISADQRANQRERMRDIKQRQKDMMRHQKQRIKDLSK